MRLAFLVPAPDYEAQWRWAFDAEAAALVAGGVEVDPIAWTEAGDLTGYDLVLPLVAWGYHHRPDQWFAFLDRLEREALPVVNPPALLRWNSDKKYLAELDERGIPTVHTLAVDALDEAHLSQARSRFGTDRLVVKPPISGSAYKTFLIDASEGVPAAASGQRMIVQPFVEAIAQGEYSLILFDGLLSHSVIKRPREGDYRVQPDHGGTTSLCEPPEGAEQLARDSLAAAPAPATYARVDIIRDDSGELRIMELELVEPALFLHLVPEAESRFAAAIRSAAERAREQPLAQGRG